MVRLMDISGALLPAMPQNLNLLEKSALIEKEAVHNTLKPVSLDVKLDEQFSSYASLLSKKKVDARNMSPDEFFSLQSGGKFVFRL